MAWDPSRLCLDDQARIPRREVTPDLHPSALFLQDTDFRRRVITPAAVDGLDQLLLGKGGQGHGDTVFPCQLRGETDVLAHQFGRKEALVPIRLKVATEPALRQTMNTTSATAKGT